MFSARAASRSGSSSPGHTNRALLLDFSSLASEAVLYPASGGCSYRSRSDSELGYVGLSQPPLTEECERIVSLGYLKGADLWHLAGALFLDPGAEELAFLTLDRRQQELAEKLGFRS